MRVLTDGSAFNYKFGNAKPLQANRGRLHEAEHIQVPLKTRGVYRDGDCDTAATMRHSMFVSLCALLILAHMPKN